SPSRCFAFLARCVFMVRSCFLTPISNDVRKSMLCLPEIKAAYDANRERNTQGSGHQRPVNLKIRKKAGAEPLHHGAYRVQRKQRPAAWRKKIRWIKYGADPESQLNHKGNNVLDVPIAHVQRSKQHADSQSNQEHFEDNNRPEEQRPSWLYLVIEQ